MERKTPSKYRNRSQAAVSQQAPHRASGPGIAKPLRQTGRGPAQSRAVPTAGTPNALAWCLQDATSPKPAGRRRRAGKLSLEHQRGWERLRRPMGIREQPQFLRSFLPKTDFIARLQLPPCCPHAGDQPLQHQRALYRPRQRECCWGHGPTARVSRGTWPHKPKTRQELSNLRYFNPKTPLRRIAPWVGAPRPFAGHPECFSSNVSRSLSCEQTTNAAGLPRDELRELSASIHKTPLKCLEAFPCQASRTYSRAGFLPSKGSNSPLTSQTRSHAAGQQHQTL